jgi:hypothetical protein
MKLAIHIHLLLITSVEFCMHGSIIPRFVELDVRGNAPLLKFN